MSTYWRIFLLVLTVPFFCGALEAQTERRVVSCQVSRGPVIDGDGSDEVWNRAQTTTTFDPIAEVEITLQSLYNASTLYFLVRYPDHEESRDHRSWVWNSTKAMYEEGPDREDVFVFKWKLDQTTTDLSLLSDEAYEADLWYWKARRTDPQGFADDKIQRLFNYPTKDSLELRSKSNHPMYIKREGDAGRSAYKTSIFVEYQGDVLPRYTQRQPLGSRADVRAKGVWRDGFWTIEFARPLVTGNIDDVNFDNLKEAYGFGVSRYEIAGRSAEPDSEQPMFGSGDITEPLTLHFQAMDNR